MGSIVFTSQRLHLFVLLSLATWQVLSQNLKNEIENLKENLTQKDLELSECKENTALKGLELEEVVSKIEAILGK